MSIAGLSGFAMGFTDAVQKKRDLARFDADGARMDRYIDLMARNPGAVGGGDRVPMGLPAQGGTGTAGPSGPSSGGIFGLTDRVEGGGNYDTLFGHSQNGGRFDGVRVSDMTLAQLYDFSDPSGEYAQWVKANNPKGVVATPMGRHQIVGSTLRSAASGMGLSPDTKFTAQVQDDIANYLARNRLAGLKSPAAKRAAMRAEWDGFNNVSDAALDAAILDFEANGMGIKPMGLGVQ